MTALIDNAHFKGSDKYLMPADPESDLEGTARALWFALKQEVLFQGGEAQYYQDAAGRVGKTMSVFQTFKRLTNLPDPDRADSLYKRVLERLKTGGDIKCLKRGLPGEGSTWWIRDDYQESKVKLYDLAHRRSEAKLTPHEAGEDRVPAPVRRKKMTKAEKRRHETLKAIQDYLKSAGEMRTKEEIMAALGLKPTSAKGLLDILISQRKVFARRETSAERVVRGAIGGQAAFLYGVDKLMPLRTNDQPEKLEDAFGEDDDYPRPFDQVTEELPPGVVIYSEEVAAAVELLIQAVLQTASSTDHQELVRANDRLEEENAELRRKINQFKKLLD